MNLAANLVRSASVYADRVALRLGETGMTYREFDAGSARVAGLVRDRGIRPGDRVGVKRQVAAYKYPRQVWIVDALPKTATGKILKREIVPPAGPNQSLIWEGKNR